MVIKRWKGVWYRDYICWEEREIWVYSLVLFCFGFGILGELIKYKLKVVIYEEVFILLFGI